MYLFSIIFSIKKKYRKNEKGTRIWNVLPYNVRIQEHNDHQIDYLGITDTTKS